MIPTGRHSRSDTSFSDARGRPLSYSADTDNQIVQWVKSQTDKGAVVTNSELRKHAKEIVIKENPSFTASASWAQNFLLRHKLSLHPTTPLDQHKPINPLAQPQQVLSDVSSPATTSSPLQLQMSSMNTSASTSSPSLHTAAIPASVTPSIFSSAGLSTSNSAADDPVTSTLALLAGETGDPHHLTQSQAAALATLTELTGDAASLVDLLNSAQEAASTEAFAQASLDTGSGQIYLPDLMVPSSSVTADSQQPQSLMSLGNPLISRSEPDVIHTCSRPLSYTKETDNALASWVKQQQAAGHKVTFASLRSYAKKVVSSENPHFNASVGWVTPFLLRHNLDLKVNDKRRPTRKTATPRKLQARGEELLGSEEESTSADNSMESAEVTPTVVDTTAETSVAIASSIMSEALMEQLAQNIVDGKTAMTMASGTQSKEILPSVHEFKLPKTTPARKPRLGRTRHTLADKLEVVRLMKQYNLAGHFVCRMLGIANSTIAGWVKLVESKGPELEALSSNKKRSNRAGQGRPLSYSREKDESIAQWVRQQQELGVQVSVSDLTNYATSVIGEDNANFVASVGWRHKFLNRHGLQLSKPDKNAPHEDQQNIPIAVQTEEVCTDEFNPDSLDKAYPDELEPQLVQWVQDKVSKKGSLSVHALCRKAEEVIMPVNPMFVGSIGWALKFLYCHNLFLDPKPVNVEISRRRSSSRESLETISPKRMQIHPSAITDNGTENTVSPSTGNLCEALLALSNADLGTPPALSKSRDALSDDRNHSTYFGKPAREFSGEEKEEVVRYANATTLQKAAIKYGVAAPTVWRWRMELKLHQPKYTPMQKKYIIKCAETKSLKDTAQRFGISTKTVQNWRRALQVDGTLTDDHMIQPGSLEEQSEVEMIASSATSTPSGLITEEVIQMDNSPFEYIVDGGEVTEASRGQDQDEITAAVSTSLTSPTPLEVTHEIQVQDVGMEYDVVSSEGHAAKPRCTHQEKLHILQYALNHSIKEASQKFGISPGTLYYWKKNLMGNKGKQQSPGDDTPSSSAGASEGASFPLSGLETAVVSVPIPSDVSVMASSSNSGLMPSSVEAIQALATGMDTSVLSQSLTDPLSGQSSSSNNDLIQAITQTLANATPEQLQSLQHITSDLNLLQAVTSMVVTQEGGAVRQVPGELTQRHDSVGGISSPTDVLVSFQPSDHTEEVQTTPENSTLEVATQSADTEQPQAVDLASSSADPDIPQTTDQEGVADVLDNVPVTPTTTS